MEYCLFDFKNKDHLRIYPHSQEWPDVFLRFAYDEETIHILIAISIGVSTENETTS